MPAIARGDHISSDFADRSDEMRECGVTHLGPSLMRWRRLRGAKQSYVAELCGVSQATLSRIENGLCQPSQSQARRLRILMQARPDGSADHALLRLVRDSNGASHLVCDFSHRLLCASRPREREWRVSAGSLIGTSLWRYASDEIRNAEARLTDYGWYDRADSSIEFQTDANKSVEVPIRKGRTLWTRLQLSDGTMVRLVETISH